MGQTPLLTPKKGPHILSPFWVGPAPGKIEGLPLPLKTRGLGGLILLYNPTHSGILSEMTYTKPEQTRLLTDEEELSITKTCNRCDVVKPLKQFPKSILKDKEGIPRRKYYWALCLKCKVIHQPSAKRIKKENEKANRFKYNKQRKHRQIQRNKQFIFDLLSASKCIDCCTTDWRLLEFDHLPQFKKENNISEMMLAGTSITSIKKEIEKCEIVCANCHTLRTMKRGGYWRHVKLA